MSTVLRFVNIAASLGCALTYTWVMMTKENRRSYAGPGQFTRYLALWAILVATAIGLGRSIHDHRPISYVTWIFLVALSINSIAAFLTVREVARGVHQVDTPRQEN